MTVFMLLVTDTMPPTSEVVPLVAKFYMAVMLEMALALLATCYVLRCYHSEKREVRPWMKKYLLGKLANFFGIKKSKELLKEEKKEEMFRKQSDKKGLLDRMMDGNEMTQMEDLEDAAKENGVKPESVLRKRETTKDDIAEKMLEKLEIISDDVEAKGKEDMLKEQWHIIAAVIDHLAMWTFAIIIVATMVIIFSQSPGYVS